MSTYINPQNQFLVQEAKRTFYSNCNPETLSIKDLMLLILGSIIPDRSIFEITELVISQGLNKVAGMSEYELSFMFGLNESQSFHPMAVFELAKRLKYIQNSKDEVIIRSPSDAASLLMDMQHLEKEHFVALYLVTKSKVIGRETISIGSLTEAIVRPREVYRQAIRRGAYSIIGAHNHPSGDPGPSHEDVKIIQRLVEVGKLVGIKFHDHIIIGRESYRSLCEDGYISLS